MNELSERSKKLHEALDELLYSQPKESIALIEQALLAERRLAMEEAGMAIADSSKLSERDKIIACVALRAAAEKEVK